MRKIEISQNCTIRCCDEKDYVEKNKVINNACFNILASHEKSGLGADLNSAYDYVCDLNTNIYLDEVNAKIYFLFAKDKPVSFAIYSQIDNTNAWVLELIYTHKKYAKLGLASALLRVSASDLKNTYQAEEINSTVNGKNASSLYLHQSFGNVNGVKTTFDRIDERIKFHFNIEQLNAKTMEEDAKNMLF